MSSKAFLISKKLYKLNYLPTYISQEIISQLFDHLKKIETIHENVYKKKGYDDSNKTIIKKYYFVGSKNDYLEEIEEQFNALEISVSAWCSRVGLIGCALFLILRENLYLSLIPLFQKCRKDNNDLSFTMNQLLEMLERYAMEYFPFEHDLRDGIYVNRSFEYNDGKKEEIRKSIANIKIMTIDQIEKQYLDTI